MFAQITAISTSSESETGDSSINQPIKPPETGDATSEIIAEQPAPAPVEQAEIATFSSLSPLVGLFVSPTKYPLKASGDEHTSKITLEST